MPPLRVCSIGVGVNSTVMALMCDVGVITPMPDIGLYADTGWDTPNVYQTVEWLKETIKNFPIEDVKHNTSLRDDILARKGHDGSNWYIQRELEREVT